MNFFTTLELKGALEAAISFPFFKTWEDLIHYFLFDLSP